MIANDFLSIRIFIYRLLWDVTYIQLDRPELHRRYFESGGDLNPKNLGAYQPGQYQPSEEDFKTGFKEKRRFF